MQSLTPLAAVAREKGVAQAVRQIMDNPAFVVPENASAWRKTREIMLDKARIFETDFPSIPFWQPPQAVTVESAKKITVPTLIVVGGKDAPVIHELADGLAKNIRGSKRVVIPDAGHMANLENRRNSTARCLIFKRSIGGLHPERFAFSRRRRIVPTQQGVKLGRHSGGAKVRRHLML